MGRSTNIIKSFSRTNLNLLIQVLTGHALVAHHLRRWVPALEDECSLCQEGEETTYHLYFDCPAMRWARLETDNYKSREEAILAFFKRQVLTKLFTERSNACGQQAI